MKAMTTERKRHMKGLTIMLDEKDLADLRATAKKESFPPSVYARSLLLKALREEMTKLEIRSKLEAKRRE